MDSASPVVNAPARRTSRVVRFLLGRRADAVSDTVTERPPRRRKRALALGGAAALALAGCAPASGSGEGAVHGGEASLELPDLSTVTILGGGSGRAFLMVGLLICAMGLGFGVLTYAQLRKLPVHPSMREVAELIYTTCKAYLVKQGRFLMLLWVFVAAIIVVYYGVLINLPLGRVAIVIAFSLIGMAGSYSVAWFGIRVNTFANARTAFALSLIHISEPTRPFTLSRMPTSA